MRDFSLNIEGRDIECDDYSFTVRPRNEFMDSRLKMNMESEFKLTPTKPLSRSITDSDKLLSVTITKGSGEIISFDCFLSFYQESPSLYAVFSVSEYARVIPKGQVEKV